MDYSAKTLNIVKQPSQCLIIGVLQAGKGKLTAIGNTVDKAGKKQLGNLISSGDVSGANGAVTMVYSPRGVKAERIMLLGLGKKQAITD